ncbi:MAG: carbohydrate ABC transporter permease [Candidatus Atribacteria bacterium]|nr:carbohydrate ABC transporter permease [Candidatus Atribacteria bacterium]
MRTKTKDSKTGSYSSFIVFTFICIIFLAPFFFMLVTSFKPGQEMLSKGLTLKINFDAMTLNNYKIIFFEDNRYLTWYKNSLIITALYTVLSLFFSSLVGYGLAVYNFKGKNLLFFIVLLVMMVPLEILLLPLYRLMITLNLMDTYLGVVLPFAVSPFAIFFFRQYIIGLPKELIEAARVDGCGEFRIFFKIIAPLMKPAFGAMTILQAMTSWNAFVWPLVVLRSAKKLTLPIGLMSLLTPYGNSYDMIMPGAVMSVIPIAILFLLNQRAFIEGLTAGGIKQ